MITFDNPFPAFVIIPTANGGRMVFSADVGRSAELELGNSNANPKSVPLEARSPSKQKVQRERKKLVRIAGLEPARITPLPPQSSASANSAICARTGLNRAGARPRRKRKNHHPEINIAQIAAVAPGIRYSEPCRRPEGRPTDPRSTPTTPFLSDNERPCALPPLSSLP